MNRLGVVFWMMLAVATLRGVASGHDIGAMSVRIDATGGKECVVEVLVDMEHRSPGVSLSTPEEVAIVLQTSSELFLNGESCPLVGLSSVGEAADASGAFARIRVRYSARASGPIVQVAWRNGLPTGQYLLRVRMGPSEESSNQWLEGGIKSRIFEGQASEAEERTGAVVLTYLELGFTHIVPKGLDHILFVVGLFLLSARVRPLLKQVTAFTVAHSITLALSIYGLVQVPAWIIEPAIALSIAYVAIENLFVRRYTSWRTVVVFGFGLLHGMGFAGVLQELGLPRSQFVPALVSFNVGVEIGQLAVLLVAFGAVGAWFGAKQWYRARIAIPASVAIALVGLYWAVERVATS